MTAKEFIKREYDDLDHSNMDIEYLMKEFAKYHVEQALIAASNEAQAKENPADYGTGEIWVDKDSILNAYPLENIK